MTKMIDFFEENFIFILIVSVLLVMAILAGIEDQKSWKIYSNKHHCIKKGYISGTFGISSSGHSVYIQGKDRYVCDGGVVIER